MSQRVLRTVNQFNDVHDSHATEFVEQGDFRAALQILGSFSQSMSMLWRRSGSRRNVSVPARVRLEKRMSLSRSVTHSNSPGRRRGPGKGPPGTIEMTTTRVILDHLLKRRIEIPGRPSILGSKMLNPSRFQRRESLAAERRSRERAPVLSQSPHYRVGEISCPDIYGSDTEVESLWN